MSRRPLFARIFLTGALALVAFYALVFAGAYVFLLVPDGTVKAIGPSWYFLLCGLISGGLVGALIGIVHRNVLRAASFAWLVACMLLVLIPYAWLLSETERDWSGPGWWIPLVDLGAFAAMFVGASNFGGRKGVRESAI
jgi:hypothetical protein